MKEVIEYQVVTSTDLGQMAENVNKMIGLGYQPWKKMKVMQKDKGIVQFTYIQTMVKYKPDRIPRITKVL